MAGGIPCSSVPKLLYPVLTASAHRDHASALSLSRAMNGC